VTIEQFRAAHQAEPFRPFVLHLADGRELDVPHREFASTSPSGRTDIIYKADDSWNAVDLLLVTDLEFKPLRNGGRKRRR
jgi:hypothetical protein